MMRPWLITVRWIVRAARITAGRPCASGSVVSSWALTLMRLSGCFSSCDMTARNSFFFSLSATAIASPICAVIRACSCSSSTRRRPVMSRQILA